MSINIFFDLEGPLSPSDNAYELMKLFKGGQKIFQIISRYDDLLTLEQKPGYEPGDTLSLIAPFLIYHGISEADIVNLGSKAALTNGAAELVAHLLANNYQVFCISTSYKPFALRITKQLNISPRNVACTNFSLDRLSKTFESKDFIVIKHFEQKIQKVDAIDDEWIKSNLDEFFWSELPKTKLGAVFKKVKPVGGKRKVDALAKFACKSKTPLLKCVAIGDSITDYKMLKLVNESGGLAIAFNGNEFVLQYATVGLASTNIFDLYELIQLWKDKGREEVRKWISDQEKRKTGNEMSSFQWLDGAFYIEGALIMHKLMRKKVRQDAAILG